MGLLGQLLEPRDQLGEEGPLAEALTQLLKDAGPLGLLGRREADDCQLALQALEGGAVLGADPLGEGVRRDLAGVHHDLAQLSGQRVEIKRAAPCKRLIGLQ